MVSFLPLTFAIILSIAHYFSESFHLKKNKQRIITFGAGVLLAYLILDLFPRLFLSISFLNNILFVFILLGFSIFYLVEKYIYQHASKEKKLKDLKEFHSVAFFLYYIIIGIILFKITIENSLQGTLLFIPLLFHITLGTVSFHQIHPSIKENHLVKIILSISPVVGLIIASTILIPEVAYHSLVGFIGGVLLFVITREVIPKENKGDPVDFLLGLVSYTALIILTWIFF